jgi:hypothetical protein
VYSRSKPFPALTFKEKQFGFCIDIDIPSLITVPTAKSTLRPLFVEKTQPHNVKQEHIIIDDK